MKNHHRSMLYSAIFFLPSFLVACGGGSSSASGRNDEAAVPKDIPAVMSVTERSNYVRATAPAYPVPQSLTNLNGNPASGVRVVTGFPRPASSATDVLGQIFGGEASMVPGVSKSVPCPMGGTGNVNSSGDTLSTMKVGDVITLEASNCRLSAMTLNGGLTITVKEVIAASFSSPESHSMMQFKFNGLSIATVNQTALVDGDMTMKFDQTKAGDSIFVLSGASLKVTLKKDDIVLPNRSMRLRP